MKKINLILGLLVVLLAFNACNKEQEVTKNDDTSVSEFRQFEPILGIFTKKRPATDIEITNLDAKSKVAKFTGCSLDSDAECSNESSSEFLGYVNNCVNYPTPPFGGFYVTNTLAAISYYVDGDGDVNCDNYEDDLQNMIDNVISTTGPVWNIDANIHFVSSCNERSGQNFIVFELTIFSPQP